MQQSSHVKPAAAEHQSGDLAAVYKHVPFYKALFTLKFSDMSIVHRLYLSVGITFLLFLGSVATIFILVEQHDADFQCAHENVTAVIAAQNKLEDALVTVVATPDATTLRKVTTEWKQLQELAHNLEQSPFATIIEGQNFHDLERALREVESQHEENRLVQVTAALKASNTLTDQLLKGVLEQEQIGLVALHNAKVAFVVGLIVAIIVIILCNISIRRSLRQDTGTLLRCLKLMAQGDLRTKVQLTAKDEIGCISCLVDHVVDNTNSTLNLVKNDVDKLYAMVNANSQSIETTNEAISLQRNTAQSVSSATSEMESAVSQVVDFAKSTLKEVKSAEQASDMCRCTMQDNITTTHTLSDRLHASSEAINKIHMMSSQIESIVKAIADIADQTNLLALNATIESARAGASGKGFAIVADEIRELAIKTARSTKEVTNTINLLEEAVTNSVKVMASCEGEMDNSLQQSSRANSSIEEIMGIIAVISDMSEQIVQSCQQQSKAAGEINMSIAHISCLAEDSYEQMTGLQSNMTELHELATKQAEVLEKFQIPQDRV